MIRRNRDKSELRYTRALMRNLRLGASIFELRYTRALVHAIYGTSFTHPSGDVVSPVLDLYPFTHCQSCGGPLLTRGEGNGFLPILLAGLLLTLGEVG